MNTLTRHHVKVSGRGWQAMVFVHGFGCNRPMWRQVAPAFEAAYREVLQALDSQDVVFVGHLVSAIIGVLAAIQEANRFARLVLVAPSPPYLNGGNYVGGFEPADTEELPDAMASNYGSWRAAFAPALMHHPHQPELAAELANSFCRTAPAFARHFAGVTFRGDERAGLRQASTPALVLQSARDLIAPRTKGPYTHEPLAGSQLVVLDSAGHCPHMSTPQATMAAIPAYFQSECLLPV